MIAMDDSAKKPKTLAEMAAETQAADTTGLACPNCGCRMYVKEVAPNVERNELRRRRVCRHCGNRATTYENFV